ncbi:MAG: hypothetical protein FJW38_15080 [Acidobacteria bacterium]|nr:hypothetical protein [Acidobacteriota bacterium]
MTRRTCVFTAASAALSGQWPRWGGPNRNFVVEKCPPLKSKWPAGGPKVLWKRPLGDGYSGPSIEGDFIFTMYGRLSEEVTTAIDVRNGKTLWEQTWRSQFRSEAPDMGHGPYATPLVSNGKVFAASVTGRIDCRAAKDGALLWQHELKGTRLPYGYAASPIAFRDTVIVPCGGKGRSLVALNQSDGKQAWAANDFPNVYSSPIMINVDGLEQLVMLMDGFVFAVNAHNGDIQWRVPFQASYSIAVATPVWAPANLLFISSEYDAGAKVIKLTRNGMQTKAEEVWSANRLRLHHGNAVCVDGTLYFSSGGKGSVAILSAVDIATGKIHWQDRTIGKATFVCADKKLITLDQDGNLMLIEPSPEKLKILAKAELLTNLSWTPPVLAGTRLIIRDRKALMALELA